MSMNVRHTSKLERQGVINIRREILILIIRPVFFHISSLSGKLPISQIYTSSLKDTSVWMSFKNGWNNCLGGCWEDEPLLWFNKRWLLLFWFLFSHISALYQISNFTEFWLSTSVTWLTQWGLLLFNVFLFYHL